MPTDSGVSTKEQLAMALDSLITEAYKHSVNVDNGGFELRHDEPDIPDWEVHITRTTKRSRRERRPSK